MPLDIGINMNVMEKFNINPLGQDMAILKCVLNKTDMIYIHVVVEIVQAR